MKTDKQIEISRRVYTRLLGLYPHEHRSEYGPEMVRLFTDQCRSAVGRRGSSGLLAVWFRTLVDLCKTALIEHLSPPQAGAGLLQAVPGKPLPWKGVMLVLIPGLVIFIGQIGTLYGKDWFFSMLPWLGYACIAPAVLVWIFAKKFPVWGLIPLGLIISNHRWDFNQQIYKLTLVFILPLRDLLQKNGNPIVGDGLLGVSLIFFALVILLVWLLYRRYKFDRSVWIWLGIYALAVITSLISNTIVHLYSSYWSSTFLQAVVLSVTQIIGNTDSVFFLLLILLGTLLARRHGKLAILLPVGYLLPTILYGIYATYPGGNTAWISPVWINISVFTFRLCLAILIPVWLARSASRCEQTLATVIPVTLALVAQVGLQIGRYGGTSWLMWKGNMPWFIWTNEYVIGSVMNCLIIIAGFILALALYRSSQLKEQANTNTAALKSAGN